ncbi:hypothetical protein APUTEX25_001339 [Auxenochlorella protothecoides]|uniref:Lon protease homolog n=1 Tax=Auxenochlorella protothecoides TaxID=3075 RepID=A0A3M7L4M1_AUXPR|nr:hypothetical protein APUTEX25_001339 [Auxenochlorella protothecoides]|eukprot:RMZ56492.1 hypothetical protein APUTEX25_001339 [Auxenochlorella protothecoides]
MHILRLSSALAQAGRGSWSRSIGSRTLVNQTHPQADLRQLLAARHYSEDGDEKESGMGRIFNFKSQEAAPRNGSRRTPSGSGNGGGNGSGSPSESGQGSDGSDGASALVPASPEQRHREVMAVALSRRPLFPGGIMPVIVSNNKLIKELFQLRKQNAQAYVGAFMQRVPDAPGTAMDGVEDGSFAVDLLGSAAPPHKNDDADADPAADPSAALHEVGTFAQVHAIIPHDQGAQLLLLGHRRVRRTGLAGRDPLRVSVQHLRDGRYDPEQDELKATTMEIISTIKELLALHPLYNEQMRNFIQFGADFHDLSRLSDLAASLTTADAGALQACLEELGVAERAAQVLLLVKKEVELCRLQADIGRRVEEKISKDQRRYFLMEQLKSIKKELGLEKDEKSALVQRRGLRGGCRGVGEGRRFRERLEPLGSGVPEDVRRVIEEELEKLQAIEPASSEFNVTRNYLDWLTALPWGKISTERLDIPAAQEVLDEDHYGLDDVKERILEFIAVGKLRGSTQGKILCLVGPPGVGKTSVGRSIARALDRKYYRFSVGGLSDVAEIKGHRRTYVGAMPGKMVQCLKNTGISNPFVLIDEIDKLGRGYQGDPASALLELLDPEQNSSFLDHYLDVPVDLSKVLFMCTANLLDTIPGPLLDRMEVIRLSGYIFDEKVAIARRYLEVQARKDAGVPRGAVHITDAAMTALVEEYAREAGVRNLKKQLEKIYRKAAFRLVKEGLVDIPVVKDAQESDGEATEGPDTLPPGTPPTASIQGEVPPPAESVERERVEEEALPAFDAPAVTVDAGDLAALLGPPPFTSDKIYALGNPTRRGHGPGLDCHGRQHAAAAVERGEGKGSLRTTGQLGDVMKESAAIAHTYARRVLQARGDAAFFEQSALHVHVPAGATPKDGPSAGCAIATALLSLALARPVRPDLAMTGEVTLTGKVLPIGGVKEKTLAAKRSGVRHILFPEGNRRDWEELAEDVRAGLEVHFVEEYQQVFDLALPEEGSA